MGDLFYDRVLGCLRGGKVSMIRPDGSTRELPVYDRKGDAAAYQITSPCKLMVTTPEGDNYEVNVLSADDKGGINIEYKKLAGPLQTDQLSEQRDAEKKRLLEEAAQKAAAERKEAEIKRLEAEKNKNQ